LLPVTVNVAFDADALSATGLTPCSTGIALVTWRLTEPLVPPPGAGLVTATERTVASGKSEAGIVTVSEVGDT
jgi:hypothetical protein